MVATNVEHERRVAAEAGVFVDDVEHERRVAAVAGAFVEDYL